MNFLRPKGHVEKRDEEASISCREFRGCGMLWLDGYGISLRYQQEFISLDSRHLSLIGFH